LVFPTRTGRQRSDAAERGAPMPASGRPQLVQYRPLPQWYARRPASFFQSEIFMSQSSIYHGKDAKRRPVVRLRLHDFFLLRTSRFKSSVRSYLVFGHPRQQPFSKAVTQINRAFGPRVIVTEGNERAFGRSRIAFSQRALKPRIRRGSNGARPLREDCI